MGELDEIARAVDQRRTGRPQTLEEFAQSLPSPAPRTPAPRRRRGFGWFIQRLILLILIAGILTVGLLIPETSRLTMAAIGVLFVILVIAEGVKIGVRAAMKDRR
jgi:hypothetical protein